MNDEGGFLYLNQANEWPGFAFHNLKKQPDGSLILAAADEVSVLRGVFRGGPFLVPPSSAPWRLRVEVEPFPDETHIQLFTFTAADGDAPVYDLTADQPFKTRDGWHAAPRDVLDILLTNEPALNLWIGGTVRSDGRASPQLHQMRVDYGQDTYLSHLPAIYRRPEMQRAFLERFLSLHESVLGGLEDTINDLPRLFDPFAVPDGDYPSWLSWLAGWLAFDLNEAWHEEETRKYLAEAFHLYGQRGTLEGLRRYLKLYAGVEARIEEPGLQTSLWSLGETSTLGFTTMLAPAHLQGAVVGTSATLDQSHLTLDEELGAVLFEDLAHHFRVHVYCAELTRPGSLEDVRAVIEREKPAHTTFDLCIIEPRMRVGVQARVGIDAIVGQGPPAAQTGMVLGLGTLAAEAPLCKTEEES